MKDGQGGGRLVDNARGGQMERSTRLTCEQCRADFEPKNRNGVRKRFCSRRCKDLWTNARRLKGAALLKGQQPGRRRRRGPRVFDPSSGRSAFLQVVPQPERLALLAQAAYRLELTNDGPAVRAATAARKALASARTMHVVLPSLAEIDRQIAAATDPELRLPLEAVRDVLVHHTESVPA